MVVSEVLRLYPAAWIGMRGAIERFEFNGHEIAAGSRIMFSAAASHRLPQFFANPLVFDPLRFAPEHKHRIVPNSYVPFGSGARVCVGMPFALVELKVVLSELAWRFRFESTRNKPLPMRYNPTLAPAHGLKLKVTKL
jgi:cytochrome P450